MQQLRASMYDQEKRFELEFFRTEASEPFYVSDILITVVRAHTPVKKAGMCDSWKYFLVFLETK
jgi:hypothetical protein